MTHILFTGDCRESPDILGSFDLIIADPPYGDTSLEWDRKCKGWEVAALKGLKPTGSMWVFGSMRYFLAEGVPAGWKYAQDIVWEKHNGSGFAADRFKRVHEHVIQFYREGDVWGAVYNEVQTTPRTGPDKTGAVHRRPAHTGSVKPMAYVDDGTRLARSVQKFQSVRGKAAIHPTQKPTELLEILIRTSCPPGGLVGDFFAGSGAAGVAAKAVGRDYVGYEIDPKMAEKARMALGESV